MTGNEGTIIRRRRGCENEGKEERRDTERIEGRENRERREGRENRERRGIEEDTFCFENNRSGEGSMRRSRKERSIEDEYFVHRDQRFKYPSHRLPSSAPASVRATPDKLLDTISERNFRFYPNLNPIDNDDNSPTHSLPHSYGHHHHQSSSASLRHGSHHQLPVHSIPRRPYNLPLSATMSQLYRPHDYYSTMMTRPATSGDPPGSGNEEVMTRTMRNSSSLSKITHQSSFPPHSAPSFASSSASLQGTRPSSRPPVRPFKRYDSNEQEGGLENDHPDHEGVGGGDGNTDHEIDHSPVRGNRSRTLATATHHSDHHHRHRTKGDSSSMYSSSDSPSKYSSTQQYYQRIGGYGPVSNQREHNSSQEIQFHPHEFQYPLASSSISEGGGNGLHGVRTHSTRGDDHYDQEEEDFTNESRTNSNPEKVGSSSSGEHRRSRSSQWYPYPLTPSEAAFLLEKLEMDEIRRRIEMSAHLESSLLASSSYTKPGSVRTPEYYSYPSPLPSSSYYPPYYEPNVRQSRNPHPSQMNRYYSSDRDVPLLESSSDTFTSSSTTPKVPRSYSSQGRTGTEGGGTRTEGGGTTHGKIQRQSSLDQYHKPRVTEPVVVHPVITSHRHKFHRRSYAPPMISSTSSTRSGSTDRLLQKPNSNNSENSSSRFYSRKSVTAASSSNSNPANCTVDNTDPDPGSSRPPSSHK